jgi:hypothetical protein
MNDADHRATGVTTCVALGCILLIYGIVMLTWAYGTGDPAWTFRARRGAPEGPCFGYWIELLRLLLVVPLAMYALAAGFARQVSILLAVADRSTWTPGVTLSRVLLLLIAVGYGGYNLHRCFDRGTEGLASKTVEYGHDHLCYAGAVSDDGWTSLDAQYQSARRSLLLYSGYAAVFFSVLVPLVLIVPGYAFFSEDIHGVREARETLEQSLQGGIARQEEVASVKQQFQNFSHTLTRLATRHVRLMVAIGAAVAFDQYLGALAMSPEAQNDVIVAYAIVAINLLLLGVAFCFYYDGWQQAHRWVLDAGDHDGLAAKQYAPAAFVRNLWSYNYGAWIMTSLLASPLLASPWRDAVARVMQMLG